MVLKLHSTPAELAGRVPSNLLTLINDGNRLRFSCCPCSMTIFALLHSSSSMLGRWMVGGGIVKGGERSSHFVIVFEFPSPTVHKIQMKWDKFWGKYLILFSFVIWILKIVASFWNCST
jgi:hypothetical protein